ncbi:MAG: TRAP transporter large permease subunit, partial [Desulforhopalus sp.]|nr:TRAP transporter large permease subunit [Desulforhopalus sp.]
MGGMLIDAISIFYIFLPIFMPIIEHFGWDPVWFGVVMTLNLAVGQFTPPVAVNLYVTTQLANIRHKVPTTAFILLSRALFAAVVIVIITAMAKTVGSRWSGIFA